MRAFAANDSQFAGPHERLTLSAHLNLKVKITFTQHS
jgi:hypothetical protein